VGNLVPDIKGKTDSVFEDRLLRRIFVYEERSGWKSGKTV
jgi:hypothetical protein